VASVDDVDWTRAMLYQPQNRTAHIQILVALAVARGYDGLDLDYEHLWNNDDHAPLVAFIDEFAAAMHAAGKRASMAVPALDGPSTVWDYPAIAGALDEAHLMVYDFHTIGTHAGPTTPVGWAGAVADQAAATGHPERFMMGLPNYGVTSTSACALASCAASCTTAVATTTDHMLTCAFGHYTAGRSLNCNTNAGMLFFDDATSLEEKVQVASSHQLRGVTYWNVGGEPANFFDMIEKYY
jgi:spore germination protein YaaH